MKSPQYDQKLAKCHGMSVKQVCHSYKSHMLQLYKITCQKFRIVEKKSVSKIGTDINHRYKSRQMTAKSYYPTIKHSNGHHTAINTAQLKLPFFDQSYTRYPTTSID